MVCLYYLHRSHAALSVRRVIAKMIVRVFSLVFLFLLKLRFPTNKSVAEIIRKRYGSDAVKWLRKFEKLDFKIRKNEADLQFLQSCHQEGLTPKFLNFKLASSSLKHSRTYKQCQLMLLKEEIKTKSTIISKQKKDLEIVRNSIKKTVSLFDFAHLFCLFLVGNDSKLVKSSKFIIRNYMLLEKIVQ